MVSKPIFVHNKLFNSYASAMRRIRYIIETHNISKPFEGEEKAFFLSLLDLHVDRESKIGCGIESIYVQYNLYGQKEVGFRRIDGSIDNFSVLKCLNGGIHR